MLKPIKKVSAGGVVVHDGKILVVSQQGRSWSLPKGGVEEGEDFLSAAKREIFEETGVSNLKFIKQLPSYTRFRGGLDDKDDTSVLKTIHMYLFTTPEEKLSPRDQANPEARWVDKDKVCDILTFTKDKEFFQKIMFELGNLDGNREH